MQFAGWEPGPGATESTLVTRKDDLALLRERLLAVLPVVDPADVPKISRELRAVDLELDVLAPTSDPETEKLDELRSRREARKTGS